MAIAFRFVQFGFLCFLSADFAVKAEEETNSSLLASIDALNNGTESLVDAGSRYNTEVAVRLAYLATAAYCPNIANWRCGTACERSGRTTEVRVATSSFLAAKSIVGKQADNSCFVLFRGTSNMAGARADLGSVAMSVKPNCYAGGLACRVSATFLMEYEKTVGPIRDSLAALGCRGLPIDITGHSLGGAMSVLAAFDLSKEGYNLRNVYTFGAPRVGDMTFHVAVRETVHVPIYRVTRSDDPIPLLPWRTTEFMHVGTEVYYIGPVHLGVRFCQDEDESCSLANQHRLTSLLLTCLNPNWCGHFKYMHDMKEGLMSGRDC
eukprot:CAMPEP_0206481974 /NCGR_PEP_ID=MMETSP0324_2-20121206/38541_1 /ASSEMBLY_ACC=CAM_ASM_000836 /TAXON_ID=2866 /ORGANISM="Crypthecodinium cohnii, Strain Seligo" /LENGTH=320 /DNA_ID=CAMNT_0053959719 /DNA_START=214 /DNA_END=1173 /DNA_ORIENTATION=-